MKKFINQHIIYISLPELLAWFLYGIAIVIMGLYTPNNSILPYLDNYYEVQGKIVKVIEDVSEHKYWTTIELDNGNKYYITPKVREAHSASIISNIDSNISQAEKVTLKVASLDEEKYSPIILSLECKGIDYITIDSTIKMYRQQTADGINIWLSFKLFSFIILAIIGSGVVTQIYLIEKKANKKINISPKNGIAMKIIWTPTWILILLLAISHFIFGTAICLHKYYLHKYYSYQWYSQIIYNEWQNADKCYSIAAIIYLIIILLIIIRKVQSGEQIKYVGPGRAAKVTYR